MQMSHEVVDLYLRGIADHARARNFQHVQLQTEVLIHDLEHPKQADVDQSLILALPHIREILKVAGRSDADSLLECVRLARLAVKHHQAS